MSEEQKQDNSSQMLEEAVIEQIGNTAKGHFVPLEKIIEQKKAQTAPAANTQATPAPAAQSQPVPESKGSEDVKDNAEKPEPVKAETNPKPEDMKPEETQAEIDELDMLGLKETETLEAVKQQRAESAKEAKRLADERRVIESMLDQLGLKVVRTANGLDFTTNEKAIERASKEIDESSYLSVWDKLPAEQKELLDREAFNKIAKEIALNVQVKRPVVTPKEEVHVIDQNQIDGIFTKLSGEVMSNKQPRYPDLLSDDVQELMLKIYEKDAGFRDWMNRSPDNFESGARKLYAEAFRVIAPKRAAKALAEQRMKDNKNKQESTPSITSTAAGVSPTHKSKSAVDAFIDSMPSPKRTTR